MQLVEQHIINKHDPRYAVIDAAAFASKNLYNAANYEIRQAFIHAGKYLNYHEMQKRMQSHEAYKALPAKVSQQVLMQLDHDWDSFFKARDAYALGIAAQQAHRFETKQLIAGMQACLQANLQLELPRILEIRRIRNRSAFRRYEAERIGGIDVQNAAADEW